MVVRDIMTKHPVHIGPEATVFAAINLLNDLDIRHLPVVESGELKGIISDRDLRVFSASELVQAQMAQSNFDLGVRLSQRVADVMDPTVFFVNPETSIQEAIDIMLDQRIGAVPVVDLDNTLVGIVSYVDILKAAAPLL